MPPPDGYSQRLAIARSPDGSTFAVGAQTGRLDLYDHTGRLTRTIRTDEAGMLRVAFAPDGKRLATACGDGTVRVWETTWAGRSSHSCGTTTRRPVPRAASGWAS